MSAGDGGLDDPDPRQTGPAADLPLAADGTCDHRRLLLNEVYRLHNGSVWRWNGRELVPTRLPAQN